MSTINVSKSIWSRKGFLMLFLAAAIIICNFVLAFCQTYTAAVYIKYTENKAEQGLATNGDKLNPYEITDPYVVSKTLSQLGVPENKAGSIAQKITVTPVISAAEQEKYASWIDNFSDYEKTTEDQRPVPVYYRIEFETKESAQFAKNFLNELIRQYRSYYASKHIGECSISVIPERVIANSEYYTSVDVLQKQMRQTVEYLGCINSSDIDYRSPESGYSIEDLKNEYNLLLQTKLAPVMQHILETGACKDPQALIAALRQSSDNAQLESDKNAQIADSQKKLMAIYAEKNKDYVATVIDPSQYDYQILMQFVTDRTFNDNITAYDKLVNEYVEASILSGELLIEKTYINEKISIFETYKPGNTSYVPEEDILSIYKDYVNLQNITEQTLEGYNNYRSGRAFLQASGIRVTENMPELLYYVVSGVLALGVGCVIVIASEIKKNAKDVH